MDLIFEINWVLMKVILTCTFGEDIGDNIVDYSKNGVTGKNTVAEVLRETFQKCVIRSVSP